MCRQPAQTQSCVLRRTTASRRSRPHQSPELLTTVRLYRPRRPVRLISLQPIVPRNQQQIHRRVRRTASLAPAGPAPVVGLSRTSRIGHQLRSRIIDPSRIGRQRRSPTIDPSRIGRSRIDRQLLSQVIVQSLTGTNHLRQASVRSPSALRRQLRRGRHPSNTRNRSRRHPKRRKSGSRKSKSLQACINQKLDRSNHGILSFLRVPFLFRGDATRKALSRERLPNTERHPATASFVFFVSHSFHQDPNEGCLSCCILRARKCAI